MSGEKNVVVFGESGSGKSSTINLLLGRPAATVSDRAIGCTFEFQKYATSNYNLFDTVGLSEGSQGTMKQSFAVNQLINLLKSLEGGVSLLVFVMEKGRIKKSLDENYKLFVEAICMQKVPVVLLITHCEFEERLGTWWSENKVYFDNYGMNFASVVSGCCMNAQSGPPPMRPIIQAQNEATLAKLRDAINCNMLVPGWQVKGGWKSWFSAILKTVIRILKSFFPFLSWALPDVSNEEPSFQERLYQYFKGQGYEDLVSRQMANDIANSV